MNDDTDRTPLVRVRALSATNFRSLGDVRIDFGALTVLVGPNGAGKSSVVDALRFLSDVAKLGLRGAVTEWHGIDAVRRWSAGHPYNMRLEVELSLGDSVGSYAFELRGAKESEYGVKEERAEIRGPDGIIAYEIREGRWHDGPPDLRPPVDASSLAINLVGGDARFAPLVSALQRVGIYAIFPDTLREPQKYDPARPMDRHGKNWASVLRDQDETTWKPDLVAVLDRLTNGDIEDVRVERAAGYLVVEFHHRTSRQAKGARSKKAKWFPAAQQSDGTLRVAGIVTALLQRPALSVVGIEEPELTVHPGAISLIVDYLREAAAHGQVIVTTHSPELLDRVDATAVRVVQRSADGTVVSRMSDDQREAVHARLVSVGELLRIGALQPGLDLGSAGGA